MNDVESRIADLDFFFLLDKMHKVICVSTAKVPIVKMLDPDLGLACDMNVNNTLALENTRMIKTYVEIDPRVRPLAMIIKYWTKRRIVNDAGEHPVILQLPTLLTNVQHLAEL
jgi:DNA polymerase sigma